MWEIHMQGLARVCRSGSLAGILMTGLGMFFLYQELAAIIGQLTHLSDAVGILSAVILSVPQSTDTVGFVLHTLVSCWPLLLVMAGTRLSRGVSCQRAGNLPKKEAVNLSI